MIQRNFRLQPLDSSIIYNTSSLWKLDIPSCQMESNLRLLTGPWPGLAKTGMPKTSVVVVRVRVLMVLVVKVVNLESDKWQREGNLQISLSLKKHWQDCRTVSYDCVSMYRHQAKLARNITSMTCFSKQLGLSTAQYTSLDPLILSKISKKKHSSEHVPENKQLWLKSCS